MERYFKKWEPKDTTPNNQNKNYIPTSYLSNDGFLEENFYSKCYLTTLEQISKEKGVIIVSPCGMGKSHIMEYLYQFLPNEYTKRIQLPEYKGDISSLSAEISTIQSEKEYVLIDSLDEAPELIPSLLRFIKKHNSTPRLFLASRNIVQLENISIELKLPIYELLPLTKSNVKEFCQIENVNADSFLLEVNQSGLTSICASPLGCKNLLSSFIQEGSILNIKNDTLWENNIKKLCSENSSQTRGLNGHQGVSCNFCFNYAIKIALILKLNDKTTITPIISTQPAKDDLDFSYFEEIYFQKNDFNEIIHRAIFKPIAENKFIFTHISYFDYLAAKGLLEHIDRNKWESIMLSEDHQSIYPQWEGVVSWIASFDPTWRTLILNIQPELLLFSDNVLQSLDIIQLSKSLLIRAEHDDFKQWCWNNYTYRDRLIKLNDKKLIPIITECLNKKGNDDQQKFALDIINACRFKEFENLLFKKFKDSSINTFLRIQIGETLNELASENTKKNCLNILNEKNCDINIIGSTLNITWPHFITVKELTKILDRNIKHLSYTSSYGIFRFWLSEKFLDSLSSLPYEKDVELLKWIAQDNLTNYDPLNHYIHIKKKIFTINWIKYDSPGIYEHLAEIYLKFQKKHISPFIEKQDLLAQKENFYCDENFKKDVNKRRTFAKALINNKTSTAEDLFIYRPILDEDDLSFIWDQAEKITDINLKKKWVQSLYLNNYHIDFNKEKKRWNRLQCKFPDILPTLEKIYEKKVYVINFGKKKNLNKKNLILKLKKKRKNC